MERILHLQPTSFVVSERVARTLLVRGFKNAGVTVLQHPAARVHASGVICLPVGVAEALISSIAQPIGGVCGALSVLLRGVASKLETAKVLSATQHILQKDVSRLGSGQIDPPGKLSSVDAATWIALLVVGVAVALKLAQIFLAPVYLQ